MPWTTVVSESAWSFICLVGPTVIVTTTATGVVSTWKSASQVNANTPVPVL